MLVEFGELNFNLIILILFPIFYQIRRYIHEDDEKPIFGFFTNYLGYLCGGIIYAFCRMKKNRQSNSDENKSEKNKDLNEKDKDKGNKDEDKNYFKKSILKNYGFISSLVVIYLFPLFLDSYCSTRDDLNFKTSSSISSLFCIISYVIFSLKLPDKFGRHQKFSLIIIAICFLFNSILQIFDGSNSNILLNILILFIIDTLYGLYNVLEKIYFNDLDKKDKNDIKLFKDIPYHLMFVIGLMSLIIVLLYETITILAFGKNWDFNGIFYQFEKNFENNNLYPLTLMGDIISAFFWILGVQLTIYLISPCHFIISQSVCQIISPIFDNSLENYSIYTKIIVIFFSVIIFMAALIYNEVIIIKLCNLEFDTHKYFLIREGERDFDTNSNSNAEEPIVRESIANEENN